MISPMMMSLSFGHCSIFAIIFLSCAVHRCSPSIFHKRQIPGPPPPRQTHQRRLRALLWRGWQNPSSGCKRCFHLCPIKIHVFLTSPANASRFLKSAARTLPLPPRPGMLPRCLRFNQCIGVDLVDLEVRYGTSAKALNVVCWSTRLQIVQPVDKLHREDRDERVENCLGETLWMAGDHCT